MVTEEGGEKKSLEDLEDSSKTKDMLSKAGTHLTNAKNAFNRIRLLVKEMAKSAEADVIIRSSRGVYAMELEEQNAVDNASENMRLALTCWANTNKLISAVGKSSEEGVSGKKRLQVDRSLSSFFASISLT